MINKKVDKKGEENKTSGLNGKKKRKRKDLNPTMSIITINVNE